MSGRRTGMNMAEHRAVGCKETEMSFDPLTIPETLSGCSVPLGTCGREGVMLR